MNKNETDKREIHKRKTDKKEIHKRKTDKKEIHKKEADKQEAYGKTLYEKLVSYAESDYYGFHMPGHKRNRSLIENKLPCEIDITEIEGFDDLHHAKGVLMQMQKRAAGLYAAEETHFLVNGSTVGILAAIMGNTNRGDKILVARNCHKAVYHAIDLHGLIPIYVYPRFFEEWDINGPTEEESVKALLCKNSGIRAVVITSPTYEGVTSDIRKIAEVVHEYKIPLIVDGAHGAHFGFHPYFPEHANKQGADVVINSVHKTLPALTQTALIHINGEYADRKGIRKYLHMLQSSSPSYILMASIDSCISLLQNQGEELFASYVVRLKNMRNRLRVLKNLVLVDTDDPSKIVISVKKTEWSGKELYEVLLEEYHLQMEMAASTYILGMTSVGDTEKGMERLIGALFEIDNRQRVKQEERKSFVISCPERVYASFETEEKIKTKRTENQKSVRSLPWNQCKGFVSAEYVYLYPPGIPLLVPGERISAEIIEQLNEYKKNGFQIEGIKKDGEIEVLADA